MSRHKPLEEGHWVKWHTSDGFLMFGKVLGQPDLNRKNQFIVPVETLNGTKTVVLENSLEIVPHQPKGKMTDKKKQDIFVKLPS